MDIIWKDDIGIMDARDMKNPNLRRKVWFIRLDNKQEAQIADVRILINCLCDPEKPHVSEPMFKISTPGIKSHYELKLYGEAIFAAGRWIEYMAGLYRGKDWKSKINHLIEAFQEFEGRQGLIRKIAEEIKEKTYDGCGDTISDGYGSCAPKRCPECGGDTMGVVRPGKFQCMECG